MKDKSTLIFLPELNMSLESLSTHLSNNYNLKIEKMDYKYAKGSRIEKGDYVKCKNKNLSGEVVHVNGFVIMIKDKHNKSHLCHESELVCEMGKGGKIMIGDNVNIIDNKSLYKGHSGVVFSELSPRQVLVKILVDNNERTVIVNKTGLHKIDNFEDGGVMIAEEVFSYDTQMNEGGPIKEEGIDLFQDYKNTPPKVKRILDKYEDGFMDGDYAELEKALKELKQIGYTFEYYLDGEAYDLRPIGTKGKSEFYAKGGETYSYDMAKGGGIKKEISVYQIKKPFEVESYDNYDKILKLKKGQLVKVVEYDEGNGLAFLNINGELYTTYDLMDFAKWIKGNKIVPIYAKGGGVGEYKYKANFSFKQDYGHSQSDILSYSKSVKDVLVKKGYSPYVKHFGIEVYAKNKQSANNLIKRWREYGINWPELGDFEEIKGYVSKYAKGGGVKPSEWSKEYSYYVVTDSGTPEEEKFYWLNEDGVNAVANLHKNSSLRIYESKNGKEKFEIGFPYEREYAKGGGVGKKMGYGQEIDAILGNYEETPIKVKVLELISSDPHGEVYLVEYPKGYLDILNRDFLASKEMGTTEYVVPRDESKKVWVSLSEDVKKGSKTTEDYLQDKAKKYGLKITKYTTGGAVGVLENKIKVAKNQMKRAEDTGNGGWVAMLKKRIAKYERELSKLKNGGEVTSTQKNKVGKVMHEWKVGKLHSGSKKGPVVKSQKQAVAIALSEAGLSKKMKGGKMCGWKHKK